jgi:hypothetical protein
MQPTFFTDRLKAARSEPATDPLVAVIKDLVARLEDGAISTAALLGLLGMRPSTDNARRIAPIMRDLGFVAWKSHRLQAGAGRGPECRGWLRPVRPLKHPIRTTEPARVAEPSTPADHSTVTPYHRATCAAEAAPRVARPGE